jgi:uncharacterized protein with HEPN domain
LRLEDILDATEQIEFYLQGFDEERFRQDRRTVDAVTRNLEIIGEAVKHLPESLLTTEPEIPWRAISGIRDILAHAYFRTEDSIIWDTATTHLKPLKQATQRLLKS